MGMETALSKPAVASVFMEGLNKFEQIFQEVLLYSGLSPDHAKILSQRMLSIYQGYPIRDIFFLDESATILPF